MDLSARDQIQAKFVAATFTPEETAAANAIRTAASAFATTVFETVVPSSVATAAYDKIGEASHLAIRAITGGLSPIDWTLPGGDLMTIEAKTTFTAPKRHTTFTSKLASGTTITAHQDAVAIVFANTGNYIFFDDIDAYIEILFAVKADRAAAAEFEKKWLTENATEEAA
jgi:hypothetical protein